MPTLEQFTTEYNEFNELMVTLEEGDHRTEYWLCSDCGQVAGYYAQVRPVASCAVYWECDCDLES